MYLLSYSLTYLSSVLLMLSIMWSVTADVYRSASSCIDERGWRTIWERTNW